MFSLPDVLPFAATCGIQRVTVEPEQVVLRLPAAERLEDHRGAVHPSAVTALAHVATAAVLACNFDLSRTNVSVRETRTRFRRTPRSALLCVAPLPGDDVARLKAALARDGSVDYHFAVTIRDVDGDGVAEIELTYAFRARG